MTHVGRAAYDLADTTLTMVDAEGLLKIVLVLVVIWLGLRVLGVLVDIGLELFDSLIGIILVVLIVLFLLDRI